MADSTCTCRYKVELLMAMHDQINSVYISIRLNTHHIPIKKLGIGSLVSSSLAFYGQRSSNRK